MKGSIFFRKSIGRWIVAWYHAPHGKQYQIPRYKGEFMYHRKIAEKCLAEIQSTWEDSQRGLKAFRIEQWTGKGFTDVIEFFQEWLTLKESKKPATIKGYRSYFRNWIKPFFEANPVMLHDVQLDTLHKLRLSIKLQPKGVFNVMNCFHGFMDYAWRSRRIPEIPPFPKKGDYGLVEPTIRWLSEDRQMAIIDAIPTEHRPIFLWLKYHLRRPAEACAIKGEDYDSINKIFIVRRSVSARKVTSSTKTGVEHIIPCHPEFIGVIDSLEINLGKHIFQNPRARRKNKRYTNESLNVIWKQACRATGESISLYSGLKHSSCSQYINERGLSMSDLQVLTKHARLESVKKYASVSVARELELMTRKKPGNVVRLNAKKDR